MKSETETAVRSILSMDASIDKSALERAIHILRGSPDSEEDMMHVVRRKDALKILKVHRRTLDYYISCGYLQRVFGGGRRRALGISRDSLMAFMRQGLEGPREFNNSTGSAGNHRTTIMRRRRK
jgi:hypothetical protein